MKELYLNAEMDVVKFAVEDVIATSANADTGVTNDTTAATALTDENEGEAATAW